MASKRNEGKVHLIPTGQVVAGNNDRKVFNAQELQDLANSIAENGLAQPITVRPVPGKQLYEIVAGERRYRAMAKLLQWETVPCLVRELSDEEASAIMLAENSGRVDLDAITEAEAYRERADKFGWDVRHIAEVAGVSVERVTKRLQMLKLVPEIQHFVRIGQFPIGHALLLVELDSNRQRVALRVFNAAKTMPLSRFDEVVAELRNQQIEESQVDMFGDMLVMQVQQETLVRRGKKARTGAPISRKLPAVKVTGKDSAGDILDRYITELMQQGLTEAAEAIGTVYNALVAGNWLSVPANSVLAKTAETDETAGDAPVQEI